MNHNNAIAEFWPTIERGQRMVETTTWGLQSGVASHYIVSWHTTDGPAGTLRIWHRVGMCCFEGNCDVAEIYQFALDKLSEVSA